MSEPLLDRIGMVTLKVRQLNRSLAWYEQRMGLQVLWNEGGTAGLRARAEGSTVVILVEATNPDRFKREMIINFTSSDVQQAHRSLGNRGVSTGEIHNCGDVSAFYFTDPAGFAGMVWSPVSPFDQREEITDVLLRLTPDLQRQEAGMT